MAPYSKKDFPVSNVRRFLEPGPIVLVSSAHRHAITLSLSVDVPSLRVKSSEIRIVS